MTSATIFPDTTILIQYQALDRIDWNALLGVDQVRLMISGSVWQEMEDIKSQDISPTLARRAQITLDQLLELIEQPVDPTGSIQIGRLKDPTIDFEAEGLDPNSVTDILVASVIAYQQMHALEYVSLFTDDAETRRKARAAGIEVRALPSNYLALSKNAPDQKTVAPKAASPQPTATTLTPTAEHLVQPGPLFNTVQTSLKSAEIADKEVLTPAHDATGPLKVAPQSDLAEPALLKRKETAVREGQTAELESHEDYTPPFLAIKQEPARPDPGYVELFNLPKEPEEKLNGVAASHNPLSLTPTAMKPNSADKPLFSFKNKARISEPENPFEPLIPTEQPSEQPELRLAFGDEETRRTIIIHHPHYPTIDEISDRQAQLRKKHPKLTHVIGSNSGDGIGKDWAESVMSDEVLHQRRAHRVQRYNVALDTFYMRSEKYLSETAEFENFRRRSSQLNISLYNDLPESLKSLYIAIHFPGNVRVYSEDNLPEKPQSPTPPTKPDLDALFEKIHLPDVPLPSEITNPAKINLRHRNVPPMEIRWNKGWDVIYSIREIGKKDVLPFNPLFIAFNSFDHATSFRIHYRITVASASYEELGELEVLVRKEL